MLGAQPPRPHVHPPSKSLVTKIDRTLPALLPVIPVWTLALFSQLTVPPAYDDAHVFFSIEGDRVVAYSLPSGMQVWMVSARPHFSPAAGGGLLFLVEPDALTALKASDGSVAWQLPFGERLAVRPVFDNGWLVAATDGGEILAFRASDGHLVWRRDLSSRASAAPALAADRVYVPTADGRIVALRVESGEPLWERRLGGAPNEILALTERLYVGSMDNFFYCLMTKDGRVDWRWRTGGDVIGLPIADEHRVYFVALDNVLRALDLTSGGQHWMRALPMRPITGPTRAGSTILVTGQEALVRAYDVKDGAVAAGGGTIAPGAPAPTPPAITPQPGDPLIKAPPIPIGPASVGSPTEPPEPANIVPPAAPVNLTTDAETAAPPHVIEDPVTRRPLMLMITRDIARGAGVTMVTRSFEPAIAPVSPLPNLITFSPQTPTTK